MAEETEDKKEAPKPYALVTLNNLKVRRFDHERDWKDAVATVNGKDIGFVAFKYHTDAGTYVQQDVWK